MTMFDDTAPVDPTEQLETYKKRFVKEDGTVDVDGLLKKSFHQEDHIGKLEQEHKRFRDDLKGRTTMEELIAELKKAPKNFSEDPPNQPNDTKTSQEPIDLEAVIDTKMTDFEKRLTQKQNVDFVKSELTKAWGTNYTERLKAKAKEL